VKREGARRCGRTKNELIGAQGLDGVGHEAEEENDQSEQGTELSAGIERRGIMERSGAEKAKAEEQARPNEPDGAVQKQAERKQKDGKE